MLFIAAYLMNKQGLDVARFKKLSNAYTAIAGLITLFIFTTLYTLSFYQTPYYQNVTEPLAPLHDWRFGVCIVIIVSSTYLSKKNYIVNKNNLGAISFAALITIAILPLVTFLLDPLLGFTETLQVGYQSIADVALLSSISLILCCLYFYDKIRIRQGIASYKLLFLLAFSLTMGAYFTPKILQTYHPFLIGIYASITVFLYFLIQSTKRAEFRILFKKRLVLHAFKTGGIGAFSSILNNLTGSFLPAEIYVLAKRAMAISASVSMDIFRKNKRINKKDIIVVLCIIVLAIYYAIK